MNPQYHDSNTIARIYKLLRQYWQVGIAVTLGIAFFVGSFERLKSAFMTSPRYAAGLTVLLIVTIVWFVAYIHATLEELQILEELKISPVIDSSSWFPLALIVGIAVCFGVLVATIIYTTVYCVSSIVLMLFNGVGFFLVQKSVLSASLDPQSVVPQPVVEYYLFRPFLIHQMAMLAGFFVALICSIIAHFSGSSVANWMALLIPSGTIVTGEIVIYKWRKARSALER